MLLITGCGRSGTHFTSELLKQMGLDVPHEAVGRDGAASWKHIVSGTFTYIGKKRGDVQIDSSGFSRIIHQVRHPLKVIASMQTFSDSTWNYMSHFIDMDLRSPSVHKAMQAWVGWNRLVEGKATWRFKIEELDACFPDFCENAGLAVQAMPQVPHSAKDSRTERFAPIYWEDLVTRDSDLAESVRELALRYGYADIAFAAPPALKAKNKTSFFPRIFNRVSKQHLRDVNIADEP